MNINDLNTIKTTEQSWRDFVTYSITSNFYQDVKKLSLSVQDAVELTLFNNYINTFSKDEQAKLLHDKEVFLVYAKGFVDILSEYRFNRSGYDTSIRSGFIGMIRNLLKEQKDKNGKVLDIEKYRFFHSIVKFCSSLDYITEVYDRYKAFIQHSEGI
ncbi:MAG: hypothetical protein L6Q54_04775 [Leptospiraceae bacterium]|nr:hypothetical protein [Leptospiraceae bacterium]MCK6380550.1 hypothetical protein [Leptospiraceae bacterium]NUM41801.1 hypothetical protein [Leptospiraceae bacterium]